MQDNRLNKQKKTIKIMIKIYCNKKHKTKKELCDECNNLLDYAIKRIENCKFANNKPNCSDCKIHCYKVDMREEITKVMRYSGPRTLIYSPRIALNHFIDKFKFK